MEVLLLFYYTNLCHHYTLLIQAKHFFFYLSISTLKPSTVNKTPFTSKLPANCTSHRFRYLHHRQCIPSRVGNATYKTQLLQWKFTTKFTWLCDTNALSKIRKEIMMFCARRFLNSSSASGLYSVENVLNEENLRRTVEKFAKLPSIRMQPNAPAKKAAVLIPLCVVNGEVSLLYTLRAANLKAHRGQVKMEVE